MEGMNAFWKDKTVLVTGHTGFKGSWLSLWLYQLGARVIGYALGAPSEPSLFKQAELDRYVHSIHGDIRDVSAFQEVIKRYRPECIFHLAAQSLVRRSYDHPLDNYSTNVMGTLTVLESVRVIGGVSVCQIITSDKCYENREAGLPYVEGDRLGGHDPYSNSKACAELLVQGYRDSFFSFSGATSVATVRAGNVIGGGDWAVDRIVPDCVRALQSKQPIVLRHPHAIRPWQYVLEPLSAYLMLAEQQWNHPSSFAGAWNIGPDQESDVSVLQLVQAVVSQWGEGSSHSIIYNPVLDYKTEAAVLRLNAEKAKHQLGWMPRYTLQQAIEHTVSWYKQATQQRESSSISSLCIQQLEAWQ
jgi:CDP-glucose 4,6-dehydratase